MALQELLTYLIIAAALAYAGYGLYRIIRPRKDSQGACAGACGCEKEDIRSQIYLIKNSSKKTG